MCVRVLVCVHVHVHVIVPFTECIEIQNIVSEYVLLHLELFLYYIIL